MKKRNRNKKRSVLSVILSLTLAMSLMTATAFATEENPEAADADQETDITIEALAEAYPFDEAGTEDPTGTNQTADGTTEAAEETYITEEAGTEGSDTEYAVSDVPEELTDTPESGDTDLEETEGDSLYEEEYGPEALSVEEPEDEEAGEDEEEDPEIQVFASTEGDQTLKVAQKAEGTIGDDVSFTYHLYQITEAAETITKMGDITGSEPGASLEYVIVKTDTGEEVSTETTDGSGTFAIHVGETAEFTLEAETSWYVTQDTPEAYPLVSVGSDGEYAEVVDSTNGVLYYGQIEPEPAAPVISNVSVTSNLTDNEKTYDGENVILTAEATVTPDTATVSYQWYKDGVEISGATGSTYTLDGNASDSGTYKCVVTAEDDGETAAAEAEVTVTINKADQDISYEESTVTKIDYDDPFIIDLTETVVDGRITYTSSDESVATVDSGTGEVTIVGPGYATITATAAETGNYEEATASYVLFVNEDVVEWEIDVNNDRVTWDEEHEEWVDDLTYTGEPLELEMAITLTEEEQEELVGITYQWYRFNDGTQDFDEIEGATGETYMLEDDDVNAGDYIYMCMAVVTYKSGYEHTVYGPIEVIIEKVPQDISYEETEIEKTNLDEPFTNPLTETLLSPEDGAGITYSSSNESVAVVDDEGLVTIMGAGEVTITATAAETANYAEATASYTLTILKEWDSVQYAVKLWGICTDTYSYDEGSTLQTASLTFGPATGADHLNSYVSCDSDTCIHKLSWDEIISLCEQNQGNESALQSLFGSCLKNGCTKAVELTPNETLFNMTTVNNALEQGYTGDGVSMLYCLLNYNSSPAYACRWNYSYTGYSSSDPANIYSRSRIRATLTGDSTDAREWVANSHNDYYGVNTLCDESNCLLSCFPANLQAAVVPRTTLNSGNATSGSYRNADSKTTYDKLFLFSLKEIGISASYDDGGGSDYGVNPNASDRVAYEFSGTAATASSSRGWWSRSRGSSSYYGAYVVSVSGSDGGGSVTGAYGLSPGFCIK